MTLKERASRAVGLVPVNVDRNRRRRVAAMLMVDEGVDTQRILRELGYSRQSFNRIRKRKVTSHGEVRWSELETDIRILEEHVQVRPKKRGKKPAITNLAKLAHSFLDEANDEAAVSLAGLVAGQGVCQILIAVREGRRSAISRRQKASETISPNEHSRYTYFHEACRAIRNRSSLEGGQAIEQPLLDPLLHTLGELERKCGETSIASSVHYHAADSAFLQAYDANWRFIRLVGGKGTSDCPWSLAGSRICEDVVVEGAIFDEVRNCLRALGEKFPCYGLFPIGGESLSKAVADWHPSRSNTFSWGIGPDAANQSITYAMADNAFLGLYGFVQALPSRVLPELRFPREPNLIRFRPRPQITVSPYSSTNEEGLEVKYEVLPGAIMSEVRVPEKHIKKPIEKIESRLRERIRKNSRLAVLKFQVRPTGRWRANLPLVHLLEEVMGKGHATGAPRWENDPVPCVLIPRAFLISQKSPLEDEIFSELVAAGTPEVPGTAITTKSAVFFCPKGLHRALHTAQKSGAMARFISEMNEVRESICRLYSESDTSCSIQNVDPNWITSSANPGNDLETERSNLANQAKETFEENRNKFEYDSRLRDLDREAEANIRYRSSAPAYSLEDSFHRTLRDRDASFLLRFVFPREWEFFCLQEKQFLKGFRDTLHAWIEPQLNLWFRIGSTIFAGGRTYSLSDDAFREGVTQALNRFRPTWPLRLAVENAQRMLLAGERPEFVAYWNREEVIRAFNSYLATLVRGTVIDEGHRRGAEVQLGGATDNIGAENAMDLQEPEDELLSPDPSKNPFEIFDYDAFDSIECVRRFEH